MFADPSDCATDALCRSPLKNPRRADGSPPLPPEECDAEIARDGPCGRPNADEAGGCDDDEAGATDGEGDHGAFFARGMITGRSGKTGSTEFCSGDHDGAAVADDDGAAAADGLGGVGAAAPTGSDAGSLTEGGSAGTGGGCWLLLLLLLALADGLGDVGAAAPTGSGVGSLTEGGSAGTGGGCWLLLLLLLAQGSAYLWVCVCVLELAVGAGGGACMRTLRACTGVVEEIAVGVGMRVEVAASAGVGAGTSPWGTWSLSVGFLLSCDWSGAPVGDS